MQQFHHEPNSQPLLSLIEANSIADAKLIASDELVQARLEDYLDKVCASLAYDMPYAVRREWRGEMRIHLESLVTAHIELGDAPEVAVEAALAQFGAARTVSRQLEREWNEQTRHSQPQSLTSATLQTLGVLSLTLLVTSILMLLPPPHSQRLIGIFMTVGAFSGGLLSAAVVRSHAVRAVRNVVILLSLLLCVLVTPFGTWRTALPLTLGLLVFGLTFSCLGAWVEQRSGRLRRASRRLTRLRA